MTPPESGPTGTKKAVPTPPARRATTATSAKAPAKAAPPPSPAQTATTNSEDARAEAVRVPMRGSGVDRVATGVPATARNPRRVWPD